LRGAVSKYSMGTVKRTCSAALMRTSTNGLTDRSSVFPPVQLEPSVHQSVCSDAPSASPGTKPSLT
jgi:hypothetical protein